MDAFVEGIPHALEDTGVAGKTKGEYISTFIHIFDIYHLLNIQYIICSTKIEYASCWYFETMSRRLLLLKQPDPFAIVTFNVDYMGRI